MSQEDQKSMHIFQALNHVVICRPISPGLLFVVKVIYDVQFIQGQPLTALSRKSDGTQNRSYYIFHISMCLFTSCIVLVGPFRVQPILTPRLEEEQPSTIDSFEGRFEMFHKVTVSLAMQALL